MRHFNHFRVQLKEDYWAAEYAADRLANMPFVEVVVALDLDNLHYFQVRRDPGMIAK